MGNIWFVNQWYGKTTFLSVLAVQKKTDGRVNVWGFDLDKNPRQVRASIGIVLKKSTDALVQKRY